MSILMYSDCFASSVSVWDLVIGVIFNTATLGCLLLRSDAPDRL